MKDELLNQHTGETCDMSGCEKKPVASNGVGAKLCSYHI